MNRYLLCLLGVTATLMPTLALADAPPTAITIRGEHHEVWPLEALEQRGFDVRDIPAAENAAWTYVDAVNAYLDVPEPLTDVFDYAVFSAWPDDHKALTDFLLKEENQRAFRLARKASTIRDCQMPYFGDPEGSIISLLLPNLSHLRMLGKLLVADAKRLEAKGEVDDAVETYLAVMRMGGQVSQGVTLIEGLVGVAVWQCANDNLNQLVLRQPLTPKQLEHLRKALADPSTRSATIDRGLANERRFGPSIVDELCTRPVRSIGSLFAPSNAPDTDWLFVGGNPYPAEGWGKLEVRIGQLIIPDRAIKRNMENYHDRVQAIAGTSAAAAAASGFDERQYLEDTVPQWDIVTRLLTPSFARSIQIEHRVEASQSLTRTTVAIKQYALQHDGAYPTSLDDLADLISEDATVDPFSGSRIRYKRNDTGWVLYSVGPNLVDDGGKRGERWDKEDIVVTCPPVAPPPFSGSGA